MRISPTTRQRTANVTKNFAPQARQRWCESENLSINWNVLSTRQVLPSDFWSESKLILIHWFLINRTQRVVCFVTEKLHAVPTTFGQRPNWCSTLFTFGCFFWGGGVTDCCCRLCVPHLSTLNVHFHSLLQLRSRRKCRQRGVCVMWVTHRVR